MASGERRTRLTYRAAVVGSRRIARTFAAIGSREYFMDKPTILPLTLDEEEMLWALSILQPWAEVILRGWKPTENRSWSTKRRGPFVIHAGKKYDSESECFIIST